VGEAHFWPDLARREIKRRRLLRVFERDEPIWKDEDHPELRKGAAERVREMRQQSEARFQRIERRRIVD
jgi:hypothetical protein